MVAFLCALALAAGPEMDELARKTLDAWRKQEYHLGRAGVKRARFTLHARYTRPAKAGSQPLEGKATFTWSGDDTADTADRIDFEWDKEGDGERLNVLLVYRGWGLDRFACWFQKDALLWIVKEELTTAKVTAKTRKDETFVEVKKLKAMKDHTLVFDDHGVLRRLHQAPGAPAHALAYGKSNGKLVLREYVFRDKQHELKVRFEYAVVGGYTVPRKVTQEYLRDRKPVETLVLTFSNWAFNADVK